MRSKGALIIVLMLSAARLLSGASTDIEASAGMIRKRSLPVGGVADVAFRILVTNRSDRLLRLPTSGYFDYVHIDGDRLQARLEWSVPNAENGTPLIVSPSTLGIVELHPGESAIIVLETRVNVEDLDRPKEVRLVVTNDFGRRYGVTDGSWDVPCRGPK